MTVKKPASLPLVLLGGAALLFALVAAKCESHTEFPGFVDENCIDGVDNDEDGQKDCVDVDCAVACAVEVFITAPAPAVADSLKISGTHRNATSISIQVTPSGAGGAANIVGESWDFMIKGISGTGIHTITATATSAKGLKDTDSATFQRGN